MQIFDSVQISRPQGCENMNQYINVSMSIVQVDKFGSYLDPEKVVIAFENSHIRRALDSKKLKEVLFVEKQEPKTSKKSKKSEEITSEIPEKTEAEEALIDVPAVEQEEDLPVVATETSDI